MPYYAEPYDNSRSTGTILDIMSRGAAARAAAIRASGDAAARAQMVSGEAYGDLGRNLGAIALGTGKQISDYYSPQNQALTEERKAAAADRADALQQRQAAVARHQAVSQLMQSALTTDPTTGIVTYDRQRLMSGLAPMGLPPEELKNYLSALDETDAVVSKAKAAQGDALKSIATLVDRTGNDPAVFQAEVERAIQNGVISRNMAAPYLSAVQREPQHVATITGAILGKQPNLHNVGAGESVIDANNPTAGPVYTAPEKPVPVAPGTSLVKPNTGEVTYTAPAKKAFEQKNVTLDGKPNQLVNYDAASGQMFMPGSAEPIDPSRVRGNTPASVIIRNENAKGLNLPAWATNSARPTGTDGNVMDPGIRKTPNGLYQDAVNFIANGQYPPTGRGSDPIAVAQRAAIDAKVGAIAADAGMDVPALRAFYKANQASLTATQKSFDSVQSFMRTADRNADLLAKVLPKIPDMGSAVFNGPLRSIDQQALGSVDVAQFKTYIQSVQNEYARILTQPNLSGVLSDSARQEAQQLIDPKATVKQILGSIEALRNEGDNRMTSLGEQIQKIQGRMTVNPSNPNSAQPDLVYDPATKTFKKPGGKG